jgi:hypothetical protein
MFMRKILDQIVTSYVDAQTLLSLLKEYRKPRDCIARAVKSGELIRLKNGFFINNSYFLHREKEYPYEQIANLIYGPSYVSLEWALSFYGLIPERVSVVTSVTIGSAKQFSTPIGTFIFKHLSIARYSVGIAYKKIEGQLGGFLIATPEKALADWVFFSCKGLNEEQLIVDLIESKRIEKSSLRALDASLMKKIAEQYRSNSIRTLSKVLFRL